MKVTSIAHASLLIESDSGTTLLTDPAFFSDLVYMFPRPADIAWDLPEIDILYVSHLHNDHFDEETLRKIKPLVKKAYVNTNQPDMVSKFKTLGYSVEVIPDSYPVTVKDITITSYFGPESGFDSMLVAEADGKCVLHGNDVILEKNEYYTKIGEKHSIDYAFVPYDSNDYFPLCVNSSPDILEGLFEAKKPKVFKDLLDQIKLLKPKKVFPYAWGFVNTTSSLLWTNRIRSMPSEFVDYVNYNSNIPAFDTSPGSCIDNDIVSSPAHHYIVWGTNVTSFMSNLNAHFNDLSVAKAYPFYRNLPTMKPKNPVGELQMFLKQRMALSALPEHLVGKTFKIRIWSGSDAWDTFVHVERTDLISFTDSLLKDCKDIVAVRMWYNLLKGLNSGSNASFGNLWSGLVQIGEYINSDSDFSDIEAYHNNIKNQAEAYGHLFGALEFGYPVFVPKQD